ncbi:MAG: hypothetical protein LBE34_02675 [Flavobacteriaceae bacterium]|jgi:hypothetical protein|nr:hypothetical protein [Flavobacteriaceae bacterium]
MNEVKEYLNEYIRFIHDFEKVIRKKLELVTEDVYEEINWIYIDSNRLMNYKHGYIDGYEYHFHGAGCFVQKGEVKCDFDYIHFIDDLTYSFTTYKFKDFVDSYYGINIDEKKLFESLKILTYDGFLQFVVLGGIVYNSFLVKRYS